MIRFECRVCRAALWLSEVGVWLSGEPFCDTSCSGQIEEMLRQKTPSVEAHLQALPTLIGDAGIYVRQVSEYVVGILQREEALARAERAKALTRGVPMVGLMVGITAAADTYGMDSEIESFRHSLWGQFARLEVLMKDTVRRSMALHQAGFAMAPTLVAAVQNTDRLDPDDVRSASDILIQIFADLEQAYRLVLTWAEA